VAKTKSSGKLRGADIVAQTLDRAGLRTIFTLSGNHIMPLFDAAIGTGLDLVHVRHEAAAVFMADAYGRLTRTPGIEMVTGVPGHTNAVSALYTALAAESPLILLSGHVGRDEIGRGAFQELPQAAFAAPVTKASWTAENVAMLGHDLAKAARIATSGRPGPVHISLPFDILEEEIADSAGLWPHANAFAPVPMPLSDIAADATHAALAAAKQPVILVGPTLCDAPGKALQRQLSDAIRAPVVGMENPRGLNDATNGAFAEMLPRADLVVLLGRPHDFAIKFGKPPFVEAAAKFVVIDPDTALIERAVREQGERVVHTAVADPVSAAHALMARAPKNPNRAAAWREEVAAAVTYQPPAWAETRSAASGPLHPLDLSRVVAPIIENDANAILICEGGEIGQWPQAVIRPRRRVVNGAAGPIGGAIPFALAARVVEKTAPIVVMMGDGAFGFHMAEFETAARLNLPFVVVLGNDAAWNAERQIQIREYGKDRAVGCELTAARYDQAVQALGGHGELVTKPDELKPAIERALASGKPACINVMIERVPAPTIRRGP
jgi:acetolactate synthase-1/2/3 large subunit